MSTLIRKISQYMPLNSSCNKIYGGMTASAVENPPSQLSQFTDNDKHHREITETPPIIKKQIVAPEINSNWSAALQTMLDVPPANFPLRMMLGGIVFSLAFLGWAWFGKIEEIGHAQGQLVPQGEVYKIHPVELGKVANIAVKEGDRVYAGQVLLELDTQLARSEVERLEQMLAANQIEYNQKQVLLEKIRLEAKTRADIAAAETQTQEHAIAGSKEKISTLTKMLKQLQKDADADVSRQERLKPLVDKTKNLLGQMQIDIDAQQERLTRLKALVVEGAIAKEQVFQAEQTLRDRMRAVTQTELQEVTSTKEQIFQAQQSLRDRQRSITQTQGEIEQAKAEGDRLQVGLVQKRSEAHRIHLSSQQQIQQLEVELTQLKAKMTEMENLRESANAKLKQRFIYAPIDGAVSSLKVQHQGEVVQPGQIVAEIAPENSSLVLLAKLPDREAGFVKVGMPVQVKLDSYPYQDYGIISGNVLSISPDSQPDQQLGIIYKVQVNLERNYVTANNQEIKFKSGQTATADIIIRSRRILDVFLDPIKKLQKGTLDL